MVDEEVPKKEEGEAPTAATAEDGAAAGGEKAETGEKTNGEKKESSEKEAVAATIVDGYDISKPIPRVVRPDKDEHETEMAKINASIEELKEKRRSIQSKIESRVDGNKKSPAGSMREALSKLRSKKGALIDEKRALRSKLDVAKAQAEKLMKDKKDAKSTVRFNSVDEISKEIARLQKKQETTSMSLADEKRLIKEMDTLQASKRVVEELKDKDLSLEGVKQRRKAIGGEIAAKDKEIDAVQAEIDERQTQLKSLQEKEAGGRSELKKMFGERDDLKKKMDAAFTERNTCRNKFREDNNAWYASQRAVKAQKKIQYEEEKTRREEEQKAWDKKQEEEEMKKIPYEEEKALCDYLADYLTKTYLTDPEKEKRKNREELEEKRKAEFKAVKDDPFAGFKPMSKSGENEIFLQMGNGKQKRRRGKKGGVGGGGGGSAVQPFTLSVDSFEQFGMLSLTPPIRRDQVENSVEELREKKEWYSKQPRGSVPTAQEIRKEKERAAAKLRQSNEKLGGSTSGTGGGSKKKVAARGFSEDDFTPLSGVVASSAVVNVTWGHKSVPLPPAAGMVVPPADEEGEVEAAEETPVDMVP